MTETKLKVGGIYRYSRSGGPGRPGRPGRSSSYVYNEISEIISITTEANVVTVHELILESPQAPFRVGKVYTYGEDIISSFYELLPEAEADMWKLCK